jgi:hypothetical protein
MLSQLYDDGEWRVVLKKGRNFDQYIVYNYMKPHPNQDKLYGKSFFNRQLAEKGFQDVKKTLPTIDKLLLK